MPPSNEHREPAGPLKRDIPWRYASHDLLSMFNIDPAVGGTRVVCQDEARVRFAGPMGRLTTG